MIDRKVEVGEKYGRLTLIKEAEPLYSKHNRKIRIFFFKCDCGNIVKRRLVEVRRGNTRSCGCLAKESKSSFKHGLSKKFSYQSWNAMLSRCNNKKNKAYKNYGGRGIKVCNRWRNVENFYEDMGDRPEGKSLDRIDNNGNYCKENCRWATAKEQANNKRNNTTIIYKNEKTSIGSLALELSKKVGIPYRRIAYRIRNGWDEKDWLINKKFKNQYR